MPLSFRGVQQFIKAQGGTVSPAPLLEEEAVLTRQESRIDFGQLLEKPETYRVPYSFPNDSSTSIFRFFEDGIQRTLLIGHIRWDQYHIPVHYCCVAAAILQRTDRQLSAWSHPIIKQQLLISRQYVQHHDAYELLPRDLEVVDIPAETPNYYELRRLAMRQAKKQRLDVENEIIDAWFKAFEGSDDFLVVDGTTINLRGERAVDRCVGISKSFRTLYCSLSDYQKVLQMGQCERSWAFRFREEDEDLQEGMRDRISWYLRLRERSGHHPEYGLVRVEVSLCHKDQISDLADMLSRSIVSERYPVSFPDTRWHNLLYPIHRCEVFLKSVVPSIESIRAKVGRY